MRKRKKRQRDDESPSRRILAEYVARRGGLPERGEKDPRDDRDELDLDAIRQKARRLSNGRTS
jgi:hypothetical protein